MLSGGSGMAYILASLFSLHSFVVGAAFGIGREIDQVGRCSVIVSPQSCQVRRFCGFNLEASVTAKTVRAPVTALSKVLKLALLLHRSGFCKLLCESGTLGITDLDPQFPCHASSRSSSQPKLRIQL